MILREISAMAVFIPTSRISAFSACLRVVISLQTDTI